jgi:hypothetical protein
MVQITAILPTYDVHENERDASTFYNDNDDDQKSA